MKQFTKEELEKVWSDEPIGWLKRFNKFGKKMKDFTVKVTPYKITKLEEIKVHVMATSKSTIDMRLVRNAVDEKYPDGVQYNYAFFEGKV